MGLLWNFLIITRHLVQWKNQIQNYSCFKLRLQKTKDSTSRSITVIYCCALHADEVFVWYNGRSYSLNCVQMPSEETLIVRHSHIYTNIPCFATIVAVAKSEESNQKEKTHLTNHTC
jgi:hypothetical protein